jgi:hypothetical protein
MQWCLWPQPADLWGVADLCVQLTRGRVSEKGNLAHGQSGPLTLIAGRLYKTTMRAVDHAVHHVTGSRCTLTHRGAPISHVQQLH